MRTNLLGKTGLEISVLGLGGHEYRWLYEGNIVDGHQIRFNPERAKLVARALEKGVNFFDTTFQEEVHSLGHVLRQIGGRDKIYINGMVVNVLDQIRPMQKNERKEFIRSELETRLELLDSDYFDIFMLCNIGKGYDRENALEVLDLFQRHRDAGKLRFIGASCHHSYDILTDFLKMAPQIDVMMFSYNYALTHESGSSLDSLLAEINKKNIGMVAMKPLCWTMYGIPFTAINGTWHDLHELVKQSFAWQVTKGQAHTNVVGVETVEDFEDIVAGIAMQCDEQLLAPYLEHKDRLELLVRNGSKHSREIQSRIVNRCREQMGRDLGDSLEAYIKEFADPPL